MPLPWYGKNEIGDEKMQGKEEKSKRLSFLSPKGAVSICNIACEPHGAGPILRYASDYGELTHNCLRVFIPFTRANKIVIIRKT